MNKQERTELKKKGKKLYWTAYLLGFGAILILVLLFLTPLVNVLRGGFNHESFTIQILSVAAVVMSIVVPLLLSLFVISNASWKIQKLYKYKAEINDMRNKHHMKLFWEAVRSADYDEAKRLYNLDKFIVGSERVLTNGILMGIATQLPIDVDWAKKVDERMKSYLI